MKVCGCREAAKIIVAFHSGDSPVTDGSFQGRTDDVCVCVNHEWRRWRQKKKLPKKKASYPSRGSGHVNDICEQHSVCEQQWQTVNEGVRSRKWIGSVVRFRVLVPETRDYFFFFLFSGRER